MSHVLQQLSDKYPELDACLPDIERAEQPPEGVTGKSQRFLPIYRPICIRLEEVLFLS